MTEQERRIAIEHQEVLTDIRAILTTSSGLRFFKYLFKHLGVAELPELGLEGNILMDKLGSLRAGQSVYKLVTEANAEIAGSLLAQKEKDLYAALYDDYGSGDEADEARR